MTQFDKLLKDLNACTEARKWAKGQSFYHVWTTCERGDWLLWLCARMTGKDGWPTRQQLTLAACDCAELALKYVESGEDRPRLAIETARKWARGEATLDEVRSARRAACAAYAAAADAAAVAYAAAFAAAAAGTQTLKTCADLVRKAIPQPTFKESA